MAWIAERKLSYARQMPIAPPMAGALRYRASRLKCGEGGADRPSAELQVPIMNQDTG